MRNGMHAVVFTGRRRNDFPPNQSKSGDYQEVAWTWRLYCAAAIQHLHRVIFSKEGSSSTISSKWKRSLPREEIVWLLLRF